MAGMPAILQISSQVVMYAGVAISFKNGASLFCLAAGVKRLLID